MAKEKKNGRIIKEFRDFLMRGNVLDLAVGVIIGGAFQAIINSVVNDLIMPLVGWVTGGINFSDQFLVLRYPGGVEVAYQSLAAAKAAGASTFAYGAFVTALLNFFIMAVVIFLMVKGINKLQSIRQKPEEKEVTTKSCPFCCSEIPVKATRCPNCTSEIGE